jgi:enoyl-CoA hydratase
MLEARYGLIPDLGGMHHLARLVGPARTKELVWTTRTVEGDEAERLGLVNKMVEPQDLASSADELLRACISYPPLATALTKELIGDAFGRPLEEEMDREADAQAAAIGGTTDGAG